MESWRIFGNGFYYVSKSGSDAGGTTGGPNDPFRTLNAAITAIEANIGVANATIVVGAGYYAEDLNFLRANMNYQFQADGKVVLTGLNTGGGLIHSQNITLHFSFNGFEFEGIGNFYVGSGSGPIMYNFSDCILRDVVLDVLGDATFSRNVIITSVIYSGLITMNKCSLFGSTLGFGSTNQSLVACTNNYFDGSSRLVRLNTAQIGIMDYNNYDFPGGCTVEFYNGSTSSGALNSLADVQTYNGSWNQHSLGAASGFNGNSPEDYTLNSSSPMAYAASDGKHIGAYDIALSHGIGQAFDSAATGFSSSNVVNNGTGWVLDTGQSVGTITSGFIDLGSLQTVGTIRLFATQFPPGEVVDTDNTADNPNRQTYELSWGPDSGNMSPFVLMEWNKQPSVNVGTGGAIIYGNGDPDFEVNTESLIQARVLQVRVTIRNNGIAG